jgi:hypothetical protein
MSPKPSPNRRHNYLLSALLISLGIAAFVQRHVLLNPLAINDDMRNQVYWMARLVDPDLFPHDLIASYFTQSSLVSPLLWLLDWLTSHGLDPIRASQFLPLALAPLATFFVYRLGESHAGKRYGFLAAFSFNLMIWIISNLAGGLSRAFAYPMLFAFLFFLSKNNRWGLILTCWLASLIYPPILFLSAAIWLTCFFPLGQASQRPLNLQNVPLATPAPPDKISFLIGVGGGLAILANRFLMAPANPLFGALTNSAVAAQTPEFYQGGRVPIFHYFQSPIHLPWPNALFANILARTPGINRIVPLLGILLVYWLFQKFLAPKMGALKIPALAWRTFNSAIGLYILAWMVLFYMYVPERYLQLSIPVLYTFLLAGLLNVVIQRISKIKIGTPLKRFLMACPLLLSGLIFSFVWDENMMLPNPEMSAIFEYLKHTPKNTLVATTPGLASDIPFYAHRSVLVSQEAYIPFHQAYFQEMKSRLKDFLVAYYSVEPAPIIQFIRKYHVDYMVVNTQDFRNHQTDRLSKKHYHSFSRDFYAQLLKGHTEQDYLLSHPQPSCRVLESGQLILISTQALLKKSCWDATK